MTLVKRVSTFFLAAMAIVLVCYSALLYACVSYYLNRQFDQQMQGALNTLVAGVEVEADDVKWEPSDHTISIGAGDGLEDVRWAVFNERGKVIDHSRNFAPLKQMFASTLALSRSDAFPADRTLALNDWRYLYHRLAAPEPKPADQRDKFEHAELIVTVGRPVGNLRAVLWGIGVLVSVLPLAAWLVAAGFGRWYCRQALEPLNAMAIRARTMTADDSGQRLPVAATGDELEELGAAFNNLLDQLHEMLDQQRRFAGDAAHQLRTPLTVFQGQIDVALRRPRAADEYCRTLTVLKTQAAELRQVVEGLLFMVRASGDATLPGAEPLPLDEWLPHYLQRWHDHPRWPDLHARTAVGVVVSASAPLLAQLLENLIGNAFKYSPAGSPVTVSVAKQHGRAGLAVEDKGIGISQKERASIFEPFFRSSSARQSGVAGTGLGLAIAARIATVLGGQLDCESELGTGSRFTVQLPLCEPGQPPVTQSADQDSAI